VEINVYDSFRDMLESEGLGKVLPDCDNLEEGVAIYESIPSYKERCARNGCVALNLKTLENS
jgi:ASC-1-like (ASCH) protein